MNRKLKCVASNLLLLLRQKLKVQQLTMVEAMRLKAEEALGVKATVLKDFLNFGVEESMVPPIAKPAKAPKKKKEMNQNATKPSSEEIKEAELEQNDWRNYVVQFPDYQDKEQSSSQPPKHKYTIHLHRAMFTEELFEMYKRYELAVHKKERNKA